MVGIGNWGYDSATRHNVGFRVIDRIFDALRGPGKSPEPVDCKARGILYRMSFPRGFFEGRRLRSHTGMLDKLRDSWPSCSQDHEKADFSLLLYKPRSFVNACGPKVRTLSKRIAR